MKSIENFAIGSLEDGRAYKRLNDLLIVEKAANDRESVAIHINSVKGLSLFEKLSLLKEGFADLAETLVDNPVFKEANFIVASSWIVTKNPGLLMKFGFHIGMDPKGPQVNKWARLYTTRKVRFKAQIPEEFRDIEPGFAWISKEDFLKRFANPDSQMSVSD